MMHLIDQVHESWPQVSNQSLRNPKSGNSSMQWWWAAVNWRVEFDQVIGISIPRSSNQALEAPSSLQSFLSIPHHQWPSKETCENQGGKIEAQPTDLANLSNHHSLYLLVWQSSQFIAVYHQSLLQFIIRVYWRKQQFRDNRDFSYFLKPHRLYPPFSLPSLYFDIAFQPWGGIGASATQGPVRRIIRWKGGEVRGRAWYVHATWRIISTKLLGEDVLHVR